MVSDVKTINILRKFLWARQLQSNPSKSVGIFDIGNDSWIWICGQKIIKNGVSKSAVKSFSWTLLAFLMCIPILGVHQVFQHFLMALYGIIFYIHGSRHRDSMLIRSNEMQQYAGVYLLQNYSTCFGCSSHSSSGVHQTVTAASGTGHSVTATTFRWRKIVALTLWPVPEAVVTVWCTPDDGCDGHPKHVE